MKSDKDKNKSKLTPKKKKICSFYISVKVNNKFINILV